MILFKLLLQVFQNIGSVSFSTAYVLIAGHVMHFSQVEMFEPIGISACTDLGHVFDSGFIAFYHDFDSGVWCCRLAVVLRLIAGWLPYRSLAKDF
jgi:hypothetical protein